MFDKKEWRKKFYKEHPNYNTDKVKEQRSLDKELGIRYRGWEAMPGETFRDFKRRLKSERRPTF